MNTTSSKPLGFWSCWALTVGCMIGSGVFTLPAVLAPYGLMSFGGWLITSAGAITLALIFARLAARTPRSGGPYLYAQDAFGAFPGFLVAWGHWCSYVISIATVAVAFAGYLPVFFPALDDNATCQALCALALIWTLTFVNMSGLQQAGLVQIVTTILKIAPLILIVGLGFAAGDVANLPPLNPGAVPVASTLAATALLTLWAFTGFEAGAMPASAVKDAATTVPRAIITGMLTVTAIYLAATFAVMALVPAEVLGTTSAPFAEAARGLGPWGPTLIGAGALVATAGTLNGMIFVAGQMPMAVALDRMAPKIFTRLSAGGAPYVSLLFSSALGSLFMLANYSRGTLGAFQFLAIMSTLTVLLPYLVSALAELRHAWTSARAWIAIALTGAAYSVFAIIGSGLEAILWGVVLLAAGAPLYLVVRGARSAGAAP